MKPVIEKRVFWRRVLQVWSMGIVTQVTLWVTSTPDINGAHATIATSAIGVFGTVMAFIEKKQNENDQARH